MKISLISMIILTIFVTLGSYFNIEAVPYVVTATVIIVLVLSAFRKIPEKCYPVLVWGLVLSLILQQTMLGSYIIGTDIHGEYFLANKTIENGWDLNYINLNSTSIVLNIFTPILSKIGIPVLWQFKLVYPILMSLTPLILYKALIKQFKPNVAFYSVLFFVIVPIFIIEITGIVKSMVAEVFMAIIVFTICSSMSGYKRVIILSICGILAIMSHYTVGTMVVFYLSIMSVILIIYKLVSKKNNYISILIPVLLIVVIGAGWLKVSGGGIVFTGYRNAFFGVKEQTVDAFNSYNSSNNSDKKLYLDKQDSLVKTALFMDWDKASMAGKIFRGIQYITQIAIILGFIFIIVKRKEYKLSMNYLAGIISSGILLVMVLFIPKLANTINTTRWYQFALFFCSSLFVIGLMRIGKEKLVAGILIAYFIFTSGFMFKVLNKDIPTTTIDIPYSLAYSHDLGIVGMYNNNDVKCAKWVLDNRGELLVYTSYAGIYILMDYEEYTYEFFDREPQKPYILFLTTQDIQNNRMVFGTLPGMRGYRPIRNLDNYEIIHKEGQAVAYLCEE